MKIGIIGAMEEEVIYFQESMKEYKNEKQGIITFFVGQRQGHQVIICKCGVGKVNAALTAQMLIDRYQIEQLIFTGVAGAVDEHLNVGDVVISESCQEHDIDASALGFERGTIPMHEGTSIFPANEKLKLKALHAANEIISPNAKAITGKVVSGDQFIANKKDVDTLRELFAASCVEMEGAAVAHVAHFNEIPYVIIRSISDKANGEAAESFEQFVESAAKTSSNIVENLLQSL